MAGAPFEDDAGEDVSGGGGPCGENGILVLCAMLTGGCPGCGG